MNRALLHRVGFAFRESGQALERVGCRLQGIYSFEETLNRHAAVLPMRYNVPSLAKSSWVAPSGVVPGSVSLGAYRSVWCGAIVRGDSQPVTVGANSNLQQPAAEEYTAPEMSREVLDAQERYPLADRALSMPALLQMVGKTWPKGRRTDVPSLDDLLDAPDPPRGIDGRLLSDMLVKEVVEHFIKPATEGAYCSYITAFNSGKLKEEHAALLAPADVHLEYWASGDIRCYMEWLKDPSLVYDYHAGKSYDRKLPAVATTTWFVSHTWRRPWRELVDMVW